MVKYIRFLFWAGRRRLARRQTVEIERGREILGRWRMAQSVLHARGLMSHQETEREAGGPGMASWRALRAFQRSAGIAEDYFGPLTLEALGI